jgi:hypothetical protein
MTRSLNVASLLLTAVMTTSCVGTIESTPGRDVDAAPGDPSGTPPPPPPPSGTPDARPPDADLPDADPALPDAGDNFLTCREPSPQRIDGNHNAGRNCMQCHSAAGPGPRWYAAGTVFADGNGTPRVGATITIRDATGKTVDIVTATNGNFWTPEPLQYPLVTFASSCPDIRSMGPEVPVASAGACNSCHGVNVGRIILP